VPNDAPPATHFETRLDRLAELAIRTGLGLREGQELVMTAPIEALPLVRRLTEHAYRQGATLVTTLFGDDRQALLRYRHAQSAEAFDVAPAWLFEGMADSLPRRRRAARGGGGRSLPAIGRGSREGRAGEPRAQQGLPPGAGAHHGLRHQLEPRARRDARLGAGRLPRAAGGRGGGAAVGRDLPRLPRGRSRPGGGMGAAQRHAACAHGLPQRQGLRGAALPGPRHRPARRAGRRPSLGGGAEPAKNGITCNPNIPTEEVFTTPAQGPGGGRVRSTKPLAYRAR
jgi:aminopeptidase